MHAGEKATTHHDLLIFKTNEVWNKTGKRYFAKGILRRGFGLLFAEGLANPG